MKNNLLNRDLTWVDFNYRVLSQTKLNKNPLGEKFNFLQITQTNLDEFIMVRYAKALHNDKDLARQLEKEIKLFVENQDIVCQNLINDMQYHHNVSLEYNINALTDSERHQLNDIFRDISKDIQRVSRKSLVSKNLYAIIIRGKDEPFIVNLENVQRFICLGTSKRYKYVRIEDVIKHSDYRIKKVILFRVCTDGYFDLDSISDEDLCLQMENIIRRRDTSRPIYLETENGSDEDLIKTYLCLKDKIFVIKRRFVGLNKINKLAEYLPKFSSHSTNRKKVKKKDNIFKILNEQDILLNHPFDSYDTIVRLLEDAAESNKVTHIYQTLYRVSGVDSPIVNALCRAAKNGIKVTVLVEVKARFSEGTNLEIIKRLEKCGVKIIMPTSKIKVHAKAMLIVTKNKYYSHIGTGNYNEKTAKIYTDISLLTSNEDVGEDLYNLFKMLADKKYDKKFRTISSKPGLIREKLMKELSKMEKGGTVTIKCNALCDPKMCNAILKAAERGVEFNIICRGACSLQPSKQIKITSIVGRYLEHGRIYRFKSKKRDRIYISSADLLSRNLDRRVELLYRVTDPVSRAKIKLILKAYKKDDMNKFVFGKGDWYPLKGTKSAYNEFYKEEFNERLSEEKSKIYKKKNEEEKLKRVGQKIYNKGQVNGYGYPVNY